MQDSEYWRDLRENERNERLIRDSAARDVSSAHMPTEADRRQWAEEADRKLAQEQAEKEKADAAWKRIKDGPEPQNPAEAARQIERQSDKKVVSDIESLLTVDNERRIEFQKNAPESNKDALRDARIAARGISSAFWDKWNEPEPHLSPTLKAEADFKAKAAITAQAADRLRQVIDTLPPEHKLMDPTESYREHVRKEQIGKLPTTDSERVIHAERMKDLAEVDAKAGTPGHKEATRAFDQKWIQPERDARKAARQAAENPDREALIPPQAAAPEQVNNQQEGQMDINQHEHEREHDQNGAGAWAGEATPWVDPEDASERDLDLIEASQADVLTAEQVWGAEPTPDTAESSDGEVLEASILARQGAGVGAIGEPAAQTPHDARPAETQTAPNACPTTAPIRPAPPVRDQQRQNNGRVIVAPPPLRSQPRPATAKPIHQTTVRPAGAPSMRATVKLAGAPRTDIRPAGLPSRDAAAAKSPAASSPLRAVIDAAKTSPQNANQQTHAASR